jgi:hypothetical protein
LANVGGTVITLIKDTKHKSLAGVSTDLFSIGSFYCCQIAKFQFGKDFYWNSDKFLPIKFEKQIAKIKNQKIKVSTYLFEQSKIQFSKNF